MLKCNRTDLNNNTALLSPNTYCSRQYARKTLVVEVGQNSSVNRSVFGVYYIWYG